MNKIGYTFTVYFDDPFYIGIVEKRENHLLSVSKIVFGKEPKDQEVYAYILHHFDRLSFTSSTKIVQNKLHNTFKKRKKEARKSMVKTIGTKSQLTLQKQYELNKKEHKEKTKLEKEKEKNRRYEIKCQKKIEKHKGH